jgi:hypothetical protein
LATAGFQDFEIVFDSIIGVSSSSLNMTLHINGAFQTTGYLALCTLNTSAAISPLQGTATTSVPLTLVSASYLVNSGQSGASGKMNIWDAQNTTRPKSFDSLMNYFASSLSVVANVASFGQWTAGNYAIDGFSLQFATGNISSGTVKIYGIK